LNLGPEAPVNFTFGGGASSTLLHPLMLAAMIIALAAIFFAPRRYLSFPFLLVIFWGSIGQQIYVAGLHFYVLRILVMAGVLRMIVSTFSSKDGLFVGGFDWIDRFFVLWISFRCLAGILLNNAAAGAINYQVSFLIDALGGYLFLRFLIRDEEDILRVVKIFAALTFIFALTMVNEKFHGQNIFGYLGVVPVTPTVREGSIRAQAAFAHPILAGTFGVSLMPLFWWLWSSGKAKTAGILGFCGSLGMMLTSASSTPLLAFLAALVGWCAWPIRNKMRIVRWGVVVALIALHLVMKAPVWFLIARADLIAGSSGYHRALLIDLCIRHFSDWWLIGTNAAGSWDWDMWDTSNQFVQEAESGGLVAFICFVMIVARSFNKLGKARRIVQDDPQQERFMWLLAVALFTNCVCFFGISYFDHTKIMWFALLAIVAAATAPILASQKSKAPVAEQYPIPLPLKKPAFPAPKLARVGRRVTSTTSKGFQPSGRLRY
jgi:hypothetical protein